MPDPLIESFDYYPTSISEAGYGLQSVWVSSVGANAFIAGRFGGQACLFQAQTSSTSPVFTARLIPTGYDTFTIGMAWRWPGGGRSAIGNTIFAMRTAAGNERVQINHDDLGRLYLLTNGVVRVQSLPERALTPNTWRYIEFSVKLAVAGHCELHIDGQLQGSFTGNTGAFTDVDRIGFWSAAGTNAPGSTVVDDLYVLFGEENILGEMRMHPFDATSDDVVQWTRLSGATNFGMITQSDGDTTYNSSNTVGQFDQFNFGQITANPTTIFGVLISYASRKDDAGTRTIKSRVNSGGTVANGPDFNLTNVYTWKHDWFPTDPNTTTTWTKASYNAGKYGYDLVL